MSFARETPSSIASWGAGEPDGQRCFFRYDGFTVGTVDARLTVPPGSWAQVEIREVGTGELLPFGKGVLTVTRDDSSGFSPVHRVFEKETLTGFQVQFPGPGAYVIEFELPVSGRTERRTIVVGDAPIDTIVLTPQ